MDIKDAIKELVIEVLEEEGLRQQEEKPKPSTGKAGTTKKPVTGKKPKVEEVTLESLQAKLGEMMEDKGKPAIVKLFAKFKAKKLADIEEDDYTKLNDEIDKQMKPADEDDAGDDLKDLLGD